MKIVDLHPETWRRLLARRAQLPHALLFTGQRGIGKLALARAFAELLLCEQPSGDAACARCLACNWLAQGNHPDFRLLQPAALGEAAEEEVPEGKAEGSEGGTRKKASAQITIDQVRGLDDFLHVGSHRHGARIILVNPAEAMNRATANALLKSLEEPTPGVLFLLVSNEAARLLPTIRSRCQVVPVPRPDPTLAAAWLRAEGIDDAERWLALAGGAPLRAAAMGSTEPGGDRALLDALVGELARGDRLDPLAAAAALDRVVKAEKAPAPLVRLLVWLQHWLCDLSLAQAGQPPRHFLREQAALQRLGRAADLRRLLAFSAKAIQYRAQAEQPLNSRLFLDELCIGYAAIFSRG